MTTTTRKALPLAVLVGASLAATEAAAVVPPTITDQGRLFDADGVPVNDTLDVTFTIYDAAMGGTAIWTETHAITFDEGYYSVELGETTPFDSTVIDGSTRWIGIAVAGDDEMSPRGVVGSVPYAMLANDVNGDINPSSVNIQGYGPVIDENGQWVGEPAGFAGPQGPQGAIGPAGPAGPQGPQGAAGPQGAVGATGPQGAAGAAGPQGPAGPQGTAGATGPQGPAGPQGTTGAAGPQGVAGTTGPQGATGPQGLQGDIGPTGPQGAQGLQGDIGPTGPQGAQGLQGDIGPTGPQGAQGPQGDIGPTGPQGNTGATGPQGASGPQGATGAIGPQGTTGATGPQGTTGATGPQGPAGTVANAYAHGAAPEPLVDPAANTYAFLGPTVTVTWAAGNTIHVVSTVSLGTTAVAGATLARLSICHQPQAGGALVDHLNDFHEVRMTVNNKAPLTVSQRIAGIPAGTYLVGLCYQTTAGQGANWNDNGWVNNRVLVLQN